MEGVHNDGTSADTPMTPIERQMQVIATNIQDLARKTTRQNKELWHAIRKGLPTPPDDNQPPPQKKSRMDDQEADSQQVTHRRDDEAQKIPSPNRHREESARSFVHPNRHRPARSVQSSKQLDRSTRLSRGLDDKTVHLEKELHEMKKIDGRHEE